MKPAMKILTASALACTLFGTSYAQSAEVNLNLAHFMPQNSWQQNVIFNDWKQAVEEQSDGRIAVTVYPAQTLGRAPAGYDNAVSGITDIAWTVQGYTAGRFPLSQLMELPGLFETGAVGSCAFQKLYNSGALDEEYKESKVLYVHTHSPGHLHTRETQVTSLEDLKGLKIRRPTAVIGELLTELGAEPIGMPAPEVYPGLQRGVIDGYMFPWETIQSFRTGEVTDYHLEFGFYSLAFVTTMNKNSYDSLPEDLKKVIDDNSGMEWAVTAGRGYDDADVLSLESIRASDAVITQLSPEEQAQWQSAADKVVQAYVTQLDNQGLPGSETLASVREYVEECEVEL
ncbi:TRAP transporter substrate-binding protein [Saccharospirillum sp.]|uniref:TRAP transporter substrate-binding protein n=1 Tax=Saccharospirillum sp. TaxID=2033801 RepID=UPI0034A05470